jgi:hypothetical protein
VPIPKFTQLPPKTLEDLRRVRDDLLAWKELPEPARDVVKHWDNLIEEWIQRADLPLMVRRNTHEMICEEILHESGRAIAPCDNSPAHWVMIQCFDEKKPSIAQIAQQLRDIPMTMVLSKKEAERAGYKYPNAMARMPNAAKQGWYLAHKIAVASGIKGKLENAPMDKIQDHFRRLMKPSNMMLIPKTIAGLAELDLFFGGDDAT